jgi:type IV pilus assembly protein PilW
MAEPIFSCNTIRAAGSCAHVGWFSTGLSLIELLIGLLCSSLLMLAAVQLVMSQLQSSYTQEGLSAVTENGQFGLQFVRDELHMAGANTDPSASAVSPLVWHLSVDGARFDAFTLQRRLSTSGDQLCTGAPIAANNWDDNARVVWSEYLVQADTTRPGVFQLVCRYRYPGRLAQSNDTLVPPVDGRGIIIDGVDSLQVLYGVVPSDQIYATTAQSYLPRTQINPQQDRVVDIKLALLLRSETAFGLSVISSLEAAPVYALLDQQATSTAGSWLDDRRLHRSFYLHVPFKQASRAIEDI